ncbi:Kef-type K+ transport system membrane component KefB [Chryseobacterium sp. 16F]|uniref:Kef-type K+ transport system membrane component KefB n=1 Tax=Frigoriflavimonas asaccharolytica TaxID=2735899 RepID=A0A8J8G5W8_9FLAO|nr:Kef-type K+ transport system membrane component KefB [Frigoriflavimonas asaccharolytica]
MLLLISYFFDITTNFTKIPSVILLLAVGWVVQQVSGLFDFVIPDLFPILPLLGTIGLILIVLEGALELELNKSKMRIVRKSSLMAFAPLLIMAVGFALYLKYEWGFNFKESLINVVPFAVISSAIAIPSAINLSASKKEFVTYESSFSDIFGVILFNFATFGTVITFGGGLTFLWQLLLMIVISLIASLLLALLLGKIDHHIKYGPIIIICILIYEIAKVYHLPSLIFILLFGLILGNIDEFRNFKYFKNIKFTKMNREVFHFKEVVIEATFVIRSLFFLLFGYVMDTAEIFNTDYLIWSGAIVLTIFVIRIAFLKLMKLDIKTFLYIAPRGLITILLYLSITSDQLLPIFNQTILLQVILMTTLIMMFGLMFTKKDKKNEGDKPSKNEKVNKEIAEA